MTVLITDNFIDKIAMQHFIDKNKPTFTNAARDWRQDITAWFDLSEAEKQIWFSKARQWVDDWIIKNSDSSMSYVIENWVDVDFNQ